MTEGVAHSVLMSKNAILKFPEFVEEFSRVDRKDIFSGRVPRGWLHRISYCECVSVCVYVCVGALRLMKSRRVPNPNPETERGSKNKGLLKNVS